MPNKSSISTKNTPYSSLMRVLFFILGCVFLIIGAVGIITPGLPTTVFVLLAAACWARSSKRFYQWLIQHHIFGKMIRDWENYRAIPRQAKFMAWGMMSISCISSFYLLPSSKWWISCFASLICLATTIWMYHLPDA